jgi:hypothetical protein
MIVLIDNLEFLYLDQTINVCLMRRQCYVENLRSRLSSSSHIMHQKETIKKVLRIFMISGADEFPCPSSDRSEMTPWG